MKSVAVTLLTFLVAALESHVPRFVDLYDCYIITDVEVSDYQEDDYEQVDCEEFMAIISRAKLANTAFAVSKEVNLYDDEGIRYKLDLSRNCRYLRVDSNYFRLSKRNARRLKVLIGLT